MELTLKNIRKTFGDKTVLDDINITAGAGSAFGLLGRNGAGKTTTIRIIMGVFPADSGEVLIDGMRVSKSGARLGYLPEERGLYPKQKIISQMVYIGQLRGLTKHDATQNAMRWLARLEMNQHSEDKLMTLSKGNQQKIQLATALIDNPDIVILDEPFSGLDPVNARMLKDVVNELISEGRIVIFSSHQMSYVEEFCDTVAIMGTGKILLEGKLKEIKRSYPRLKVEIRLASVEAAQKLGERMGGAWLTEYVDTFKLVDDTITVTMKNSECRDPLLKAIVNGQAPVEMFTVMEPTLEEIFVEKAGAVNA